MGSVTSAMMMSMETGSRITLTTAVGPKTPIKLMEMEMDMDMEMSALASDVITGQSMESVNLLAPVSPELINKSSGYSIARAGESIDLVGRSGQALSDGTSDQWDFLAAKEASSGGFRVLAEGANKRDAQFRVFRFSDEGALLGRGRWVSEARSVSSGWEARYGVDINGDGELMGLPGLVDDGALSSVF